MNKVNSLTSLRFFAALAVFMHHVSTISFFSMGKLDYLGHFFYEGNTGVTFFYVLSGFIISFSYREKMISGASKAWGFILNRLARIYPVHFITFFIAIAVYYGSQNLQDITATKAFMNILLVQSWYPSLSTSFSFNGVSWSISVEMFFYSSFILLCFLSGRQIAVLLVILLSIIIFIQKSNIAHDALSNIDRVWLFYVNPLFRIVDFISGMLIFHVYKNLKHINIGLLTSSLMEVFSILLLVVFILMNGNSTPEMRLDIYYIIPISIIILVFSVSNGLMSKAITIRPLIFLGEASFSFYMIHQIVFNYYLMNVTFTMSGVNDFWISVSTIFVISILLSNILYAYYERPVNLALRRIIKNPHNFWRPSV